MTGAPIGAELMTPADLAEQDVLLWALVDGYATHRERCRACQTNPEPGVPYPYPCPHLREAIDVVLDWHHARALLSKAEALRHESLDRPWCSTR